MQHWQDPIQNAPLFISVGARWLGGLGQCTYLVPPGGALATTTTVTDTEDSGIQPDGLSVSIGLTC